MILLVGDVQIAGSVHGDIGGVVEARRKCRAAVTGVFVPAIARDSCLRAVGGVHTIHTIVVRNGNVGNASAVDTDGTRIIDPEADAGDDARRIDTPQALV